MALTAEQDQYLKDHNLGVLGTGRRDGSPQLSTVYYHYDGTDVAMSVTSDRAKLKNAVRQPKVSLAVLDGRKQLILYGVAEAIDDLDGIVAGHRRIRAAMGRESDATDEEFGTELQGLNRVILRVTPDRAFMND